VPYRTIFKEMMLMYVSLAKNSYIRLFDDIGYITNQLNNKDRVYDIYGKLFLSQISRIPKSIEQIVSSLESEFKGIDYNELSHDFMEFLSDLENEGYVVRGKNPKEIAVKMPEFTYKYFDSKTLSQTKVKHDVPIKQTSDFLYEYFLNNPKIFSCQIELTSRCNEKCRHCYLPDTRRMCDMPTTLIMNLLDQLAEEGTLGLTLSGGECLLHKDFIPILQYAREKDFSISILTNATLINDKILHAIKEANIKLLQVSLYSMKEEEHDWITQVPGSLRQTMSAIEKLVNADIPVQISCPTMKKNYKSYQDVLNWAYEHKIRAYTDFIMTARTDQTTDNLECCRLSLNETEELLNSIIDVDVEYQTILKDIKDISFLEDISDKPVCAAGCDSISITASGDFTPCASFQSYVLGNAYKHSVRDVWINSPAVKKLRSVKWKNFPMCLKCEAKPFCSMCMSRNINEEGSIFKVNKHFCEVAFLNKKIAEGYKQKVDGRTNEH